MNNRQTNRLNSIRATAHVLTENATIFAGVPAMVAQHQNLNDSIALIDSIATVQMANNTGITEAKQEFLRQMKLYSFRVAGALSTYASVTNNFPLKAQAHVTDSKFTKARDDERDDIAQAIHDAAQQNVAALADYGVLPATLTAFQTRIDTYRLAIPTPAVAKSKKKTHTELLDTELRRADMLCSERLDGLIEQFRETNPDFYSTYQSTRNIIDAGHRKKPETPAPAPANG